MIRKPRRQLFKAFFIPLLIYIFPLVGFFFYSARYEPNFFIILSVAQFIIISFLVPFHYYLARKKTEADLQKQDILEKTNLVQADLKNEEIIVEGLEKKMINYSQLKDLTDRLNMCMTLTEASSAILSSLNTFFDEYHAVKILYFFRPKTKELALLLSHKGGRRINLKMKKGDVYDDWAFKRMQPLLIEDARKDFRFDAEKISAENERTVGSLMSVPLIVSEKAIGILRVDSPLENSFSTNDLRFLTTVGDLAAVAIENAQLYERIEELAIRDSLTTLYLRGHLFDRLQMEMSRHLKRKKELSFLMIDLDEFKQYNDTYGHMAGDIVLKIIGKVLKEYFEGEGNIVCRYGGEEFGILLPECPKKKAVKLAEDLRKEIEKKEVVLRRKKTHITVSIGVATFPKDAQIKEELIQMADNVMYQAKSEGRNKVCSVP